MHHPEEGPPPLEVGTRTTEENWEQTPDGRTTLTETASTVARRAAAICRAFGAPGGSRTAGRTMADLARRGAQAARERATPGQRIAAAIAERKEALTRAWAQPEGIEGGGDG